MKTRTKPYDINSRNFFESVYENLKITQSRVILKDGRTIHSSNDTEKYNFYDFYEDFCRGGYFDQLTVPHIVCTGMATLYNLENIQYNEFTVDYLNRVGIHVYLQEAIILNFGDRKDLVLKKENLNDNQLFLTDLSSFYNIPEDRSQVYSFELNSISKFVKANNLTNVTVFTNEFETDRVLGSVYPEFKLQSFNNWIMTYENDLLSAIKDEDITIDKIEKKLLALSLRYEPHKHFVNAYIIGRDNEVSWYENQRAWEGNDLPTLEYLNSQIPFDLMQWKEQHHTVWQQLEAGNNQLRTKSPIILQGEEDLITSEGKIPCGTGLKLPVEYHARSFCYVVNETKFGQPFGYFSEKTINSMACLRPFVIVAPPYSLKYLKALGFKTFDRWWDESYDSIEDHEQRLLAIFKVIDYIESKSLTELKSIYLEMEEVLDHNRKQISIARSQCKIL